MITAKLRETFLDYFNRHGHAIIPSSTLVPKDDPTLLFTNAGMVQFKDLFLGRETRSYTRATSSQRCVRAGGKHNDLENVGFTARHHTFFEMLGNFSFGDYFKREAIAYAWEFVTKVLGLPPERLWITVYVEDDEAADIWLKDLGVDKTRFSRCGKKDNFWAMGETGPCGPCSEIFYDHGAKIPGGPPGSADAEGDRYIEIWNLVFMQYNRDLTGQLTLLPKPSVDTGMGLERIAAVMQGVHSNYEIDLFQSLIHSIAGVLKVSDLHSQSLKVLADHLRACTFLVADGVLPTNEGRGYVLRRIVRRAIRHGYKLGAKDLFFYKLVPFLMQEMGDILPAIRTSDEQIIKIFKKEEMQFAETLGQGLKILDRIIDGSTDKTIAGSEVFKLYDTYGFPVDLVADIAREKNMVLDMVGFDQEMVKQRERARKSSQFTATLDKLNIKSCTKFTGYQEMQTDAKIIGLYKDSKQVTALHSGDEGIVILDQTPFYASSGGQVGDCGQLLQDTNIFAVQDTKKINQAYGHYGIVQQGEIRAGDLLTAAINATNRKTISSNHSATHLMHAALREVLGEHVVQKGSVVDTKRLRFDFSHPEPLTNQQLLVIEVIVNQKIQDNSKVEIEVMPIKAALAKGAMALFEEKYQANVRVVTMGDTFSIELCGGTHVNRSGDIGFFKVVSEEGVAAGIRRIEAVTGLEALYWVQHNGTLLQELLALLKSDKANLSKRVTQILHNTKELEKELIKVKNQAIADSSKHLIDNAKAIKGIKILAEIIPAGDLKSLRDLADRLKNHLGSGVVVLGAINNNKVDLVAGVTKDCTDRIKAGELVKYVAGQVGGSGGGKDTMAQAGGDQPNNLANALSSIVPWVSEKI